MAKKTKHVPKFNTFTALLSNFRRSLQEKASLKSSTSEQNFVG